MWRFVQRRDLRGLYVHYIYSQCLLYERLTDETMTPDKLIEALGTLEIWHPIVPDQADLSGKICVESCVTCFDMKSNKDEQKAILTRFIESIKLFKGCRPCRRPPDQE